MYRVRNQMPGSLTISLERGGVSLQSGQSFDLESACSRTWIHECLKNQNSELYKYISKQFLAIIHDSMVGVTKDPTVVKSQELDNLSAIESTPVEDSFVKYNERKEVEEPVVEILTPKDTVVEFPDEAPLEVVEQEKPTKRGRPKKKVEAKEGVPTFTAEDFNK